MYFKIKKEMYDLKQAFILAYNQLKSNLGPYGHHPIPNTVCLWKHVSKPIQFCLCVDDFGIKDESKTDTEHLFATLQKYYTITIDWTGKNCGLTLDWDYPNCHVDIVICMPGYIE